MKRNITLKLDDELLREARVVAARQRTSVSAFITELLQARLEDEAGYEQARKRALARIRKGYEFEWSAPASRDELHER
jgi:plasmid stability protein